MVKINYRLRTSSSVSFSRLVFTYVSLGEVGPDVGVEDLPPVLDVLHGVLLALPRLRTVRLVEGDLPGLRRADEVHDLHLLAVAAKARENEMMVGVEDRTLCTIGSYVLVYASKRIALPFMY